MFSLKQTKLMSLDEKEPPKGMFGKVQTITNHEQKVQSLHGLDKLADQWRAAIREMASIDEQREELHHQYAEALHSLTDQKEAATAKLKQLAVAVQAEFGRYHLPGWRLICDDIAADVAEAEAGNET